MPLDAPARPLVPRGQETPDLSGETRKGEPDRAVPRFPAHPDSAAGGGGMVIDRLRWTDPAQNAAFAIPAVAASVWVFAYSMVFGPVAILLFYAIWLPLLLSPDPRLWAAPHRLVLLLALPALALLSVSWSDRPNVSLRAAIQYGTTVVPGLLAARTVSLRSLAHGIVIGGLAVLLYSHSVGNYAYDVVDGTYAFSGAFQSKNQLGLYASLTLVAGAGSIALARRRALAAALVLPVLAFAAITLVMTESATSLITVALAFAGFGGAAALVALKPAPRLVALVALTALVAGAGAIASQSGAFDSILGIFGKDTTLTGRTYLWSRGIEFGQGVAPTGLGYYAFWVPGRAEAEELWTEFHIPSFSGFHFHNTLVEAFVALGPVGLALVAIWMLGLPVLALRAILRGGQGRGRGGAVGMVVALSILFAIRAFVEIDFLTPYTAGSFLVPFLLLAMSDRATERDETARPTNGRAATSPRGPRREPFSRPGAFSADAK